MAGDPHGVQYTDSKEPAYISLEYSATYSWGYIVWNSVVKNIDISISIDTEISERYQY